MQLLRTNNFRQGLLVPSLNLDFTQGYFPSQLSFSRASAGTYFDSAGILQSAGVNVPRLDYDPVTLAPRGLLIEEQRTNLLPYSSALDNAAWSKITSTVTADQINSPDGTLSAELVTANNTSANNGYVSQTVANNFGTYSFTVFAKRNTATGIALQCATSVDSVSTGTTVTYNLTNQTIGSPVNYGGKVVAVSTGLKALNNGWYRCELTFTISGTSFTSTTSVRVTPYLTGDAAGVSTYVWGAQFEAGSFPTYYIPTTSAAVTRSQDLCSMNFGSWFNSIQGTLFADFLSNVNGGTSQIAGGIGAGSSNGIHIRINGVNTYGMFRDASATKDGQSVSYTIGSPRRSAVAYNVGTRVGYASGGLLALENSNASNTYELTSSQSWNKLAIGSYADLSQSSLNGWVKTVKYYRNRLPNSLLQSLSA